MDVTGITQLVAYSVAPGTDAVTRGLRSTATIVVVREDPAPVSNAA